MRNRLLFLFLVLGLLLSACGEQVGESDTTASSTATTAQETTSTLPTTPTSVGASVSDSVVVGEFPRSIAANGDLVWLVAGDQDLVAVDAAEHEIVGRVEGLDDPGRIAVLDGEVWVGAGGGSEDEPGPGDWVKIDPVLMEVTGSVSGMSMHDALAAGFGSIWGVGGEARDPSVARIDPDRMDVVATIPIDGICETCEMDYPGISDLAVSDTAVWALGYCDGCPEAQAVYRIDPTTNTAERIGRVIENEDGWAAVGQIEAVDDTVWTAMINIEDPSESDRGHLLRLDTELGTFEDVATVGRWPIDLLYAQGFLWVTDCLDATLTQVDRETGQIVGEPTLLGTPAPDDAEGEDFTCPNAVAVQGDTIWVCAFGDGTAIPVELTTDE